MIELWHATIQSLAATLFLSRRTGWAFAGAANYKIKAIFRPLITVEGEGGQSAFQRIEIEEFIVNIGQISLDGIHQTTTCKL